MLVLLVDDQYDEKAKRIARLIRAYAFVELVHAPSARDALRILKERDVALLIVDMQIPLELGGDVDKLGGRGLVDFIALRDDLKHPDKILGITSHRESYDECKEYFFERGWSILLDPDEEDIATFLRVQLRPNVERQEFDIAILTALEHTELEEVLKLPYGFSRFEVKGDISTYYKGSFVARSGGSVSVVATSAPRMGLAAAASLTTKVSLTFRPKLVAMVGIAAAVKGEANLGDIIVADPSWDWGSGKLTIKDGVVRFLSDPSQIPLKPSMASVIKTLSVQRSYLDEIYAAYSGPNRPSHRLSVHVAPVASGAVVLEDPATVDLIKDQHRKTVGVEMEAYGVMSAAHYLGDSGPASLVIKSVCDFADPAKNNDWQAYAAYTSAQYLDRLLRMHFF